MLKTSIGRLRAAGLVEGTSFLLLLGVAMPLKYFADMPMAVTVVGSAHGALFLLYGLFVVQAGMLREWKFSRMALAMVASVLPFGPFVFDRSLRIEEQEELKQREASQAAA